MEKRMRYLIWSILGEAFFFCGGFLFSVGVIGMDLIPALPPSAWITIAGGFLSVLIGLNLNATAAGILWLQAVWRDVFPGLPKWTARLFWLSLLPKFDLVFGMIPLCAAAWKRGRGTFFLALVFLCGQIAGTIPPFLPRENTEDPFGFGIPEMEPLLSAAGISAASWILFLILVPSLSGKSRRTPDAPLTETSGKAKTGSWLPAVLYTGMLAVCWSSGAAVTLLQEWRTEKKIAYLRESGVPVTRGELRAFYFRTGSVNREWTEFVNRERAFATGEELYSWEPERSLEENIAGAERAGWSPERILLTAFDGTLGEKIGLGKPTEANVLRRLLAAHPETVKQIDSLCGEDAKAPLRYDIQFDVPVCSILLPHLTVYRALQRFYADRTALALLDGNREEALRLYANGGFVSKNALQEVCLIGSLVGIACESIRLDSLSGMIASGLLDGNDLRRIESELAAREPLFRESMLDGFRAEVLLSLDVSDLMIHSGGDPGDGKSRRMNLLRDATAAPLFAYFRADRLNMLSIWAEYFRRILEERADPADKSCSSILEPGKNGYILTNMLLPAIGRAWEKEIGIRARSRLARTACRKEIFRLENGRLPDSPGELPGEPPDGADILYRKR